MRIKTIFLLLFIFVATSLYSCGCSSNDKTDDPVVPEQPEDPDQPTLADKETYLPKGAWNVEEGNDYQNENSQFTVHRMAENENVVAFWEPNFGKDPSNCSNPTFRFPLKELMEETDKMFVFYRDELKFVEKGNSLTDKYRMMMYIYYNEDGTVYGGGIDDKIGAVWLSPNRIQQKPFAAMAHELGHAFQYMVAVDGGLGFMQNATGAGGFSIVEMTSQYMLWQYYPEWIQFENYHLVTFMANTHKPFLHEANAYSSPFVLEYWADQHDKDIVGQVWRKAKKGEDPVMAYKRITNVEQGAFNDEMYDAYRKFITWDMDRIRDVSKQYVNQHSSAVSRAGNDWYQIAHSRCPGNYGYNGIRLDLPSEGNDIILDFNGVAGKSGFNEVNVDKAGWRYGFVAVKENGSRVYSDVFSKTTAQIKYTVPSNTSHLWLVVMGAPTTHWAHDCDGNDDNDAQWPYQFKLTGTSIHNSVKIESF